MSFNHFTRRLSDNSLDISCLKTRWSELNIPKKSYLINKLTSYFGLILNNSTDAIPASEVKRHCEHFYISNIRNNMPQIQVDGMKDESTGIIFEMIDGKKVATKVEVDGTIYGLNYSHVIHCISRGWDFRTSLPDIQSPYN